MKTISRDKADTLLLLASCTLVLAPHIGHLPVWIPLVCAVLLLWRAWITFRGNRMPSPWLLLPMAALAAGSVYAHYKTLFGRDAGVAMLVLLLSFKLLEMHAKRDLFVVVFLCFFLMLTNFFYSQSIATAVLMFIATIAILTTQLTFQYTGAVPPLKTRLRFGAMIVALAVPVALVMFVLFPRVQGPLWGMPGDAHAGRSGLSDTMSPGNITQLALSDDIAFRVRFVDLPPPQQQLYWRGIIFGNYDGRTWTLPKIHPRRNRSIDLRTRGAMMRHQITLEPHGRRWLFALDAPQAPPDLPGNQATMSPELQISTTQPVNSLVRYDAVSYVDFHMQPNEPAAVLRAWLELPADYNPRTLAFAARLRQQLQLHDELHNGLHNDSRIVNAVLQFFRNEKFSYTLEPPPLGQHAIDEFLFTTRAGFCEHYASAFVILMRAAGIPARVVTGYQGGEMNTVDGYMTIRQSDAHAWAEVWLRNRGWTRIDPTAAVSPDRIQYNAASVLPRRVLGGLVTLHPSRNAWLSWTSTLRMNWDAVSNMWNQWVLNYTPDRQKNLLRALGFHDPGAHVLTALMFILGAIVLGIVVYPIIKHRQTIDPIKSAYQALCESMARRGLSRAIHEGPRTYCERLTAPESPLDPAQKRSLMRFLRLYEAAQYTDMTADMTTGVAQRSAILSQLRFLLTECR